VCMRPRAWTLLLILILLILCPASARAQDSYEIQVYPSETMPRGTTMFELHSNFTARGERASVNGVAPSYHALHETVEITHGFNDWFEVGFYTFTSTQPGEGPSYIGNHIRPRFRVPPSWHWPVGMSLSQEIGFQHRRFSEETWSWEFRPIVDKQAGRFYWSLNPTLAVPLAADSGAAKEIAIEPAATITFDATPRVNVGLEYYGSLGTFSHPGVRNTAHSLYPVVNLDLGPQWEFNAGVGIGLSKAADPLLFKLILGYRVH
jgi:hypothetical protein